MRAPRETQGKSEKKEKRGELGKGESVKEELLREVKEIIIKEFLLLKWKD